MIELRPSPMQDDKTMYLHIEDDTIIAKIPITKENKNQFREELNEVSEALSMLEEYEYYND